MSVENEPIIPVQVKYIEVQSATVRRNEKIPLSSRRKTQEPLQQSCEATLRQNGVCHTPVAAENIDISCVSPVTSPGAGSPTNPLVPNKFQFDPNLTYAEKVAHEMIVTEKIYLDNLKQIIDGFLGPVANDSDLDISQENIDDLFINVEEIYQFNWVLLQDMEKCNFDPVKLAECFVLKQIGFDIYTKYCTHYPRSMEVLLEWNQREDTANFIKRQQESLGHTLPLCSFLLKPVQRILKYHLLLGNIAKHFKQAEDEEGYEIIQKALAAMTDVAKHINDMKRKHEDAVHLQEIQSVLLDYEGPNLTSFGSIVLEDTFRLHGTKTGRYLFLFEKALLITKRRSDGTFSWKATVMYSNMMLADSVFREPLTFQVIPFDDRKICYTFVSRDLETKQVWLLELKRRLLDSYAAAVPMKAKQIILGHGREDCEKENAEPDVARRSTPRLTRKGANQQRSQVNNKENPGQSTKLSKNADADRRKSKDAEDNLEEKTKTSIDSIKSPLRRKLRVFKKRKFNKDQGKSSKRVSWSSDDNNDENYADKERSTLNGQNENQEQKVSDNEPYEDHIEEKSESGEDKYLDKNDNIVSISSLLRDGATMVSVTGEEDDHLSGHVKLRPQDEVSPFKKRRLTRGEKRQKCMSMPVGQFPIILEDDPGIPRTQSTSRLYETFLESELVETPTSIKELQKYGLVSLREKNAKAKRLGSYDEGLTAEEGCVHRSATSDDVIANTGESVHQTMKRVSAAFSDISPAFSPEKSPASSTEEELTNEENTTEDLTAEDLTTEDITPGDLTPDEFTPGDVSPDEYTPGDVTPDDESTTGDLTPDDLSPAESPTASPTPDEALAGEKHPWKSETGEGTSEAEPRNDDYDEKEPITGKDVDSEPENGEWKDDGRADNEDDEDNIYDAQSQEDRNSALHSEPSSYVDTLSDSFDEQDDDDDDDDEPWLNSFDGSYQRVFSLKRSYSEENLVSKYPLDATSVDTDQSDVSSKSCTHFDHAPITRSKSAECSRRPQSWTPFTFSVTSKKKIVIKDSLWETIKEDGEVNHYDVSVAKDVHTLRRRRKRKSGNKRPRSKKSTPQSTNGRVENTHHFVRTCASLNMADYRSSRKDASQNVTSNNSKNNSAEPKLDPDDNCNEAVSLENLENEDECGQTPVTKVDVALRKKGSKVRTAKSLVHVDANVSEVPSAINYLCIEAFPSDEPHNAEDEAETRDVKRTNENTASRVERLSKYFNSVTTDAGNLQHERQNNQTEHARNGHSIKKRVEELSRREIDAQNLAKNSEEHLLVKEELNSLQNIQERIGVLRRSNSEENQRVSKTKIELTSSLNHGIPNVKQLKNKLEEHSSTDSGQNKSAKSDHELPRKISTSLRIKDRIEELRHNPESTGSVRDKKPDKNVDDDLRTCRRLKERIERLQKGARREVDSERDITISDDRGPSDGVTSPRQNEEMKTVVIRRGWVQQFIQKIETGS